MLVVCNYATLYECWVTVRMRHLKNVRTSLQDLCPDFFAGFVTCET